MGSAILKALVNIASKNPALLEEIAEAGLKLLLSELRKKADAKSA